ncbi:MAG: peptidylprolyl isomerase [Bacteroidota bacterium]
MRKNILQLGFVLIFCFFAGTLYAQQANDPVLLTVGGDKVTQSEFLSIYQKNNVKGEVIDKKSLQEYLELFINFKLKVKEAEEMGLDTATAFKTELAGYRKQLAQNYLSDNEVNDELLKQAYDRMQKDIRASHILIKCDPGAAPKDTLIAYNKIVEIRKRIMKGERFETLAKEVSDDPSAKDRDATGNRPAVKGNGGDLGYFTVFDMVYPFENGAFNTPKGEISNPIRTDYGYHILKIVEVKKAMGRVKVAHIFAAFPANATKEDSVKAKDKILEANKMLKSGIVFDTVCIKYSDDKGTASKGGLLPWFGVNRMVPDFINAVTNLQVGQVTEPFVSPFGWHIVKMVERKDIGSYEDVKSDIKQRVSKDSRAQLTKDAIVSKIKKQYGFTEYAKVKEEMLPVLDSSVFSAKWDVKKGASLKAPLCNIGDKTYTQQDFLQNLGTNQKSQSAEDLSIFLSNAYRKYVDDVCIAYKDSKLEAEYPEFRNLMKEYRDGILLFDLTDQKVWTKAIKDSVGLEAFYKTNKNNYMWGKRLDATLYKCKDKDIVEKAYKMASKSFEKSYDEAAILKKFSKDTLNPLRIDRSKFTKGDSKFVDNTNWVKGVYAPSLADPFWMFVVVHQTLEPEPKTLAEARGMITADYQSYLEKEWIRVLRQKYPVQVKQEVLSTIK